MQTHVYNSQNRAIAFFRAVLEMVKHSLTSKGLCVFQQPNYSTSLTTCLATLSFHWCHRKFLVCSF